ENAKKLFGASGVYLMFKDDALLGAIGPDALKALKEAASLKPEAGPVLNVNVAVGRVVGLNPDAKAQKAAKEVFGKATPGSDTVALTVEMGESVKLKLSVKGKILEFGSKTQKADY